MSANKQYLPSGLVEDRLGFIGTSAGDVLWLKNTSVGPTSLSPQRVICQNLKFKLSLGYADYYRM